jgi:CBS domain-containing membrane protein
MKVHEIMTHTVVTVAPKSSFKNVWKILFESRVNALPVVDRNKKLLGIITKEDLLKKLYPDYQDLIEDFTNASDFEAMESKIGTISGYTARELMNVRVIFTRTDTPAMRALSRMIARRVNQLPVVNEEDIVVGMITKGDVFYALFRKHLKREKRKKQLAAT